MIAQRIDLLALHEMAIASAVPKPMPAFAAVPEPVVMDCRDPLRTMGAQELPVFPVGHGNAGRQVSTRTGSVCVHAADNLSMSGTSLPATSPRASAGLAGLCGKRPLEDARGRNHHPKPHREDADDQSRFRCRNRMPLRDLVTAVCRGSPRLQTPISSLPASSLKIALAIHLREVAVPVLR
jgi:hypothetical protein